MQLVACVGGERFVVFQQTGTKSYVRYDGEGRQHRGAHDGGRAGKDRREAEWGAIERARARVRARGRERASSEREREGREREREERRKQGREGKREREKGNDNAGGLLRDSLVCLGKGVVERVVEGVWRHALNLSTHGHQEECKEVAHLRAERGDVYV